MKKNKNIYKFYRECFYNELDILTKKDKPSAAHKLMAFLSIRNKRIKLLNKFLKKNPSLLKNNKYLCYSLNKCKLPVYLSINDYRFKIRPTAYCSKTRVCGYCWVRSVCKSFCKLVKLVKPIKDYVYAYKEATMHIDADIDAESLKKITSSVFTKRHRFKPSCLNKSGISGLTEMLFIYPTIVDGNKRSYAITLRQLAYCHIQSDFAKLSDCKSPLRLEEPSVKFCSFPARIMLASSGNMLKINEALRSVKLMRRYGSFYNPKSKKIKGD